MEKIEKAVKKAVGELFEVEITPIISIPESEFGDYSTNVAMILAGQLGQNPRSVAEKLAGQIKGYQAEVAGPGFINFRLSDDSLLSQLSKILTDKNYGRSKIYENQVVVTEFSDPNPFKVLHAGHLYTSVIGDAISNLIESAGGTAHRVNFGGDVGLHAAKTVWAILKKIGGLLPDELSQIPKSEQADWLSQRYMEGNQAYGDDDKAKAEIVIINKKLYEITQQNDKKSPLAQIYWQTRQWSYDAFDDFYAQIGLVFEKYYPESQTAEIGLGIVERETKNGVYEKSDGVIIFNGEKYGLHTRVFVNSEGLPTYETKDVGLIFIKWDDYHFDKSVVITGNEQIEYMKVVLKSIEQFRPDLVAKTEHLTHGLVKLVGGQKMSSREGNVIKAVEVIKLTKQAFEQAQGSAPDELVLGAIRWAFLKRRIGSDLIYDPDSSVSLHGNSGPYLQYALARAKSILRKFSDLNFDDFGVTDLEAFERILLKKMAEFPEVVGQATGELSPHLICVYLYELAQIFNRFYENSKVAGHARESLRLGLVKAYENILSKGLKLLGVPTVEKM
jgi:arginyl-tRNA synthetase